jgi:hypothetical protein
VLLNLELYFYFSAYLFFWLVQSLLIEVFNRACFLLLTISSIWGVVFGGLIGVFSWHLDCLAWSLKEADWRSGWSLEGKLGSGVCSEEKGGAVGALGVGPGDQGWVGEGMIWLGLGGGIWIGKEGAVVSHLLLYLVVVSGREREKAARSDGVRAGIGSIGRIEYGRGLAGASKLGGRFVLFVVTLLCF